MTNQQKFEILKASTYGESPEQIAAAEGIFPAEALKPSKCAKYRAAPVGGDYHAWQLDNHTAGGQDGYAGTFGQTIDRPQTCGE